MARLIDREIRRQLADEILFGLLRDGGAVTVDVVDDKLAFDFEPHRAGTKKPAEKPAEVV